MVGDSLTKRQIALKESWKNRKAYHHGKTASKLYQSWRSFRFTEKGKKAGFVEEWRDYSSFYDSMISSYTDGHVLCRVDRTKPFSKENCLWLAKSDVPNGNECQLEHLGETKYLKEWCIIYGIFYPAARQRYIRREKRKFTSEEILYGRRRQLQKDKLDFDSLAEVEKRSKASKMMAQYRLKDKARGHQSEKISIDWFIENIITKNCSYCGTDKKIGADRVLNHKGHTKDNIVPACYRCNTMRFNHFTYEQMLKIGDFISREIDGQYGNRNESRGKCLD